MSSYSQGFAIVGQVVGSYFGPIGAAVGGAIGSYVGGMLDPDQIFEGSRLADLSISSSTYGSVIPIIYGRARVPTNLLWTSGMREIRTEEDVGGKGGGPETTQVLYTYESDVACLLCEGEITGITRIWANQVLVYDTRPEADIGALQASAGWARATTVYTGSESQLADPLIEAAVGVGNCPAYRGVAYVVIEGLQLGKYGNRLPNLTVEVVVGGTTTGLRKMVALEDQSPAYTTAGAGLNPITHSIEGTTLRLGNQVFGGPSSGLVNVLGYSDCEYIFTEAARPYEIAFPSYNQYFTADWLPLGVLEAGPVAVGYDAGSPPASYGLRLASPGDIILQEIAPGGGIIPTGKRLMGSAFCVDREHILIITGPDSTPVGSVPADGWYLLQYDETTSGMVIVDSGTCGSGIDQDLLGIGQGLTQSMCLESNLKRVWIADTLGEVVSVLEINSSGVLEFIDDIAITEDTLTSQPAGACWADDGICFAVRGTTRYILTIIPTIAATSPTVQEIVEDICQRAGWTLSDIDASELTDTCDGYIIARELTARGAIEDLMRAYWFDAVESDFIIKFPKRGQAAAATIDADELGATEGPQGDVAIHTERAQESELPARINVAYMELEADYQRGAQSSRRMTTGSEDVRTVEVPIVLGGNKAAQIAEVMMFDGWVSRNRRRFATTGEYLYLDPTDVVELVADDATYTVRIIDSTVSGGKLEFNSVDQAATLYDPNAIGGYVPGGGQTVELLAFSRLELMDIPMLRDADDDAGIYAAVSGYPGAWPGAQIFRSNDAGDSFEAIKATTAESAMGVALSVLGAGSGSYHFESDTVDISMIEGTLSSATALQVCNGANVALLGDEIIQFRTAELISGTQYRISGLLRGRRGTDQYRSTHAIYERFVVLTTATTLRLGVTLSDVGRPQIYRGVTFGTSLDSAIDEDLTPTAAALKPYSAVHVQAFGFGGDIVIEWVRRDRIANGWRNNVGLPMSEATESYEIDIYDGADVVRTLTSTTPTVTYTSAQQVTDFGVNPSDIDVRIYQMSATVGRGFPFIGNLE